MSSGTDPGHTEVPVRYDNFDGSTTGSLFPTYRHYLIGKLVRQNRDDGRRETLYCQCHDEPVKVFSPSITEREYKAYCSETRVNLGVADTMEQLWDVITSPPG